MILKKQSLHENLNQGQGFTFKFLSSMIGEYFEIYSVQITGNAFVKPTILGMIW